MARLAKIELSFDELITLMDGRLSAEIPKDLVIHGIQQNYISNGVTLVVESETFDDLPTEKGCIPDLPFYNLMLKRL